MTSRSLESQKQQACAGSLEPGMDDAIHHPLALCISFDLPRAWADPGPGDPGHRPGLPMQQSQDTSCKIYHSCVLPEPRTDNYLVLAQAPFTIWVRHWPRVLPSSALSVHLSSHAAERLLLPAHMSSMSAEPSCPAWSQVFTAVSDEHGEGPQCHLSSRKAVSNSVGIR